MRNNYYMIIFSDHNYKVTFQLSYLSTYLFLRYNSYINQLI